jgi:hypothetical protein
MSTAPLFRVEFFKYLGIRLTMAIENKHKSLDMCWATSLSHKNTVIQPGHYGHRFLMSKHRFKDISSAFRTADYDDAMLGEVCRSCFSGF